MPNFLIAHAEAFSFSCDEKNIKLSVEAPKDDETDWFDQDILEKNTL